MGKIRKNFIKRKLRLKPRTRKKLVKKFKKIIIITCIILSVYICIDINKYEEGTITREDISVDKEKFEFVKTIENEAKKSYKKYGILPSITVAQAILESGWGQSELTKNSNNLFGIKSDESWKGKSVEVNTTENYSDIVKAKFRKYDSIEESITDHARFLKENKRYKQHGLFEGNDYKEQAQSLENAGYSTKKNQNGELIYADMLIGLIERYNLFLMDK
ncbi:MAG: glucosaminidase domain-containing protein [Paeniclostridium sordellii]|uniref:Glucosaminidase domain-containing protein n=1 Tax=Paeniclostridium hominis TaxID=2764329 RepID=A0ABR7K761_9FIRM|nr:MULTISPECIES: glucosaminidase domain-containing protein [Paeniclostridium]MBC6004962.1 glucosaminidase domain-containing protein [Paeniclostridium hominis]MDU2592569.1 glucosaminidase domain-containing protein [Paeniclostridium sordellii]